MAKLITHASDDCIELLHKLLAYNPEDRVSARQAMRHPYLKELREMEKKAKRELISNKEGHHGGGDERLHRKSGREVVDDGGGRGLPTISKGGGGHDDSYAPSLAPTQSSIQTHGMTHGSVGSTINTQSSSLGGTYGQTQRASMGGLPELSSSAVRGMPKIGSGDQGGGYKHSSKAGQSSKLKSQYPKRSGGHKLLGQNRASDGGSSSKYGSSDKIGGVGGSHMHMQVQGGYGSSTNRGSGKYPLGLSVGGVMQGGGPKFGSNASSSVQRGDRDGGGGKNYQSPYSQKKSQHARD